jgi:phosphate transport system protein
MAEDARHFAGELEELVARLLYMGSLAEERVTSAMRALTERDPARIEDVISGDRALNGLHIDIDDRCFKLLALQQPVAVDLRVVVASAKINGDLERIGDLAVNIGEAARRYIVHRPVKPLIDIPRMAGIAQEMLRDALDAFVERRVDLARQVMERDELLDSLKDQIFRELLTYMIAAARTVEPALDLILISRHLERIGDHATNIAENVVFVVEGVDVRHHAGD